MLNTQIVGNKNVLQLSYYTFCAQVGGSREKGRKLKRALSIHFSETC